MLQFYNMDLNVPRSLETKLGFISLHNWRKCSDLQSSGYWKMYLWTFSSPWHNPLISPLCKTTPINFSEKDCPLSAMESFFKKRGSPMLYREDTMPLPNWKIMSENVLKLLTYWIGVCKSGDWVIRGQWVQTPLGNPSCFSDFVSN